MEHSLHIAVKHLIESLAPCYSKKADVGEDSNTNDDNNLEAGDALGKALALVKQVSYSLDLSHFGTNVTRIVAAGSQVTSGEGVLPWYLQSAQYPPT
jgi:hypothetical protein